MSITALSQDVMSETNTMTNDSIDHGSHIDINGKLDGDPEWTKLDVTLNNLDIIPDWNNLKLECGNDPKHLYGKGGTGKFIIKGLLNTTSANPRIIYWAANPASIVNNILWRPCLTPEIAYLDTYNKGSVIAMNRKFRIRIDYPSSYMHNSILHKPRCHIKVCDTGQIYTIILPDNNTYLGFILLILVILIIYYLFIQK